MEKRECCRCKGEMVSGDLASFGLAPGASGIPLTFGSLTFVADKFTKKHKSFLGITSGAENNFQFKTWMCKECGRIELYADLGK